MKKSSKPGPPERKILRKMKYISDQKGIMNRYLAEGDNWETHLEHTREFIRGCLETARPGTVAILGSGWLLDIPLDYLLANQDRVYLLDICHPPQIVRKVKQYEKLSLVHADLSGGGILAAYAMVKDHRKGVPVSLKDLSFQAPYVQLKPDYVISLNILNQLDILLVDYIGRYLDLAEDDRLEFRRRIQQQHIDSLPAGRSCLITDVEEHALNRKGEQVSGRNLIHADLPDPEGSRTWTWTFDTRGEYNPNSTTEMKVRALRL